jgi:hypothetical protein
LGIHLAEVTAILEQIPRAQEELAFDLSMACAWRRYVEEMQKPKVEKVEKPELNTDDLDDLFLDTFSAFELPS